MEDIRKKVFAAFYSEHKKHLATIRLFLDSRKAGKNYSETQMDDLKRCAHTLKGAARAAGLDLVQEIGLRLEKYFGRLKDCTTEIDGRILQNIRTVLDGIEVYVDDFARQPNTDPPENLIRIMDSCLDGEINELTQTPLSVESGMHKTVKAATVSQDNDLHRKVLSAFQNEYRTHLEMIRKVLDAIDTDATPSEGDINTVLRSAHTLKGAARAADLPKVQELAHGIETLFSFLRDRNASAQRDVIQVINKGLDAIEDHIVSLQQPQGITNPQSVIDTIEELVRREAGRPFNKQPDNKHIDESKKTGQPTSDSIPVKEVDAIRIDAVQMDRLQKTAEQILSEGLRQQLISRQINDLKNMVLRMAKDAGRYSLKIKKTFAGSNSQPEFEKCLQYFQDQKYHFSALISSIRELGGHTASANRMNAKLSRQIQTDVQQARMIAAQDIFQSFRKMVRDLAADEGKEVEFKVRGFDLCADRLVFQRLKDPLMHMLRNSISHGIETPDERKKAGKDPTGTINFFIEIINSRVRITIADDGYGLDFYKISDLAVKKGHLSKEEAEKISRKELLRFIFLPGFTTAKMITDLYGRGIGLSMVRDTMNRLRGEIDVQSSENNGVKFVLSVPLTISTHRILLIQAGGQTFGVPAESVDRLLQIRFKDIETIGGNPVIKHNERAIPLALLSALLDISQASSYQGDDRLSVVILHCDGQMMGVAVDSILSEAETLINDLPFPADQIPFFAGGFIGADGCASLILNPAVLMAAMNDSKSKEISFGMQNMQKEKDRAKILIVDDSITTRTLEKTILESQGYEVCVAMDGIEALDILKSKKIDLVVTDIQMPGMDGFVLIEKMKDSEKLKNMPVIIVTSMADQKDRERGLTLGADAYIVKQKFDQKNLLETIGQIL